MFNMYTIIFLLLYTVQHVHTKNLVSIWHHIIDPLCPFCPPPCLFPYGNHHSVLWIYICFCLACSFILFLFVCLFLILHMSKIIQYLLFSTWFMILSERCAIVSFTRILRGHCRVINWLNLNIVLFQQIRMSEERDRDSRKVSGTVRTYTFIDYVLHLMWSQFAVPPNHYNSNIEDHWSQITIKNIIIIMKKFEILWELPKCNPEDRSEQMLLEKWCWSTCFMQSSHKTSICKKQNMFVCEVQ